MLVIRSIFEIRMSSMGHSGELLRPGKRSEYAAAALSFPFGGVLNLLRRREREFFLLDFIKTD